MSQLICLVCGGKADCSHYGALSCRACAAFFRRKVIECREARSTCDDNCAVTTRRRDSCSRCRFQKCLNVGMKITAVYARLTEKNTVTLFDEPIGPTSPNLIHQVQDTYDKLIKFRHQTYQTSETPFSQFFNFREMNQILKTDSRIIATKVIPFFELLTNVSCVQKKLLCRHFMMKFFLLEYGFRGNGTYQLILPNGNRMTLDHKEYYYSDFENYNEEETKNVVKIMTPYWEMINFTLVAHFAELKLDFQEFLFLVALLYWDHGLADQSEETIDVCKKMRNHVIKELTKYEKINKPDEDYSLRVGNVILLLNTLQKIVLVMEQSREVTIVYGIYHMHQALFELLSV